jgi:hypothetical protein
MLLTYLNKVTLELIVVFKHPSSLKVLELSKDLELGVGRWLGRIDGDGASRLVTCL